MIDRERMEYLEYVLDNDLDPDELNDELTDEELALLESWYDRFEQALARLAADILALE